MHDFIGYVLSHFRNAILFGVLGLVLGAGLLILLRQSSRRRGKAFSIGRAVAILLLGCYLGGLAALTCFNRSDASYRELQLRPLLAFWEAWNSMGTKTWLNPLLNLAMFLPLGILLPLAGRPFRRWYRTLAAGFGLSLLVEALQYFLGLGISDVDDLICNTLGLMLGYCLSLLLVKLSEKQWKRAAVYALFPVLCLGAAAGVFLSYRIQPYGNLEYAPIFAADTDGVTWKLDCALPNVPEAVGIYWSAPFTKDSCDSFARAFAARLEIEFDSLDVDYYDNSALYSDHRSFALYVQYQDRSYEYTNFGLNGEKPAAVTEAEIRSALNRLEIRVPEEAVFLVEDEAEGRYAFEAKAACQGDGISDGTLSCRVVEQGELCQVYNCIFNGRLVREAAVISPREAYERLCAGRFSWQDVRMFAYMAPSLVRVLGCRLEWMADSKGFRQPVYIFSLYNEDGVEPEAEWTTVVPALR